MEIDNAKKEKIKVFVETYLKEKQFFGIPSSAVSNVDALCFAADDGNYTTNKRTAGKMENGLY